MRYPDTYRIYALPFHDIFMELELPFVALKIYYHLDGE